MNAAPLARYKAASDIREAGPYNVRVIRVIRGLVTKKAKRGEDLLLPALFSLGRFVRGITSWRA
jgi:hypothetical protein